MKRLHLPQVLLFCSLLTLAGCALFLNEDGFNPLNRQTEDGLPVFYIHPAPISEEYYPVTIYYRGKKYQTEARTRGSSSRHFPMKSFTIKFSDDQLFSDPEFQFTDKKRIVLITSFNDNSCIRHRLAFDLWNRMDPGHIQIKTYSAVVYLNARYWGLYTVAEHVDGLLMAEHGLYQNGNLYKGVTHSADFFLKDDLHEGFEKKEGFPEHGDEGAYTVLDDLIKFVCNTDPGDFVSQVDSILTRQEYEDWWMYVVFMLATDSCNKNAYHYLDPGNGGWRYIPWDFNYSFGQDFRTMRTNPQDKTEYTRLNNIFKRFIEQEEISGPLKDRFFDLLSTGNEFDIDWVLSKIDDYYQEIRDAALKSERRWRKQYLEYNTWDEREDFTTFKEEIQYIKDWISERHTFLLDRYD